MSHPNEFDATQDSGHDAQAFDAAARTAHADALTHVSARVQAQLQQRRRAALNGHAPAAGRPLWPMLALGGTAAVALAIGLRFVREPAETPATPGIASQSNGAQTSSAASTASVSTDRAASTGTAPDTATAMAPNTTVDPLADPSIDPAARDAIAANDAMIDTTMAEIEALLSDGSAVENPVLAMSDDALLADLDENPDLYLWLGSDEGQADTTELL
jgi:hypothetical protein